MTGLVREFTDYVPLKDAIEKLRRSVTPRPRRELVDVADSYGRVLFDDVVSAEDVPPADSSHMDGFAVRAEDLASASKDAPVSLRLVPGSPLGVVPAERLARGEARPVLTGGYLPPGADAVVQSEAARVASGRVTAGRPVRSGEFVFKRGRDVRKGELVLREGRTLRGADAVLLATLGRLRVPVYGRPRVAIIPTGNELVDRSAGSQPGKVLETHTLLLERLVEGAGGRPRVFPIARDDVGEICSSLRRALASADVVLTVAGSSVGEPDLTERAIARAGAPGVLVHGMQVFRGRVMGFGVVADRCVVILPGPIQGAVNAFALMAYPVIRSFLGRGFEEPPSLPAVVGSRWEAGDRYREFSKVVYVRVRTEGGGIVVEPSPGETEKITHLTRNDGYLLLDGPVVTLRKGERVRVHLLPGLSPSSSG